MRIGIFTDNDFQKVNGVTTTLRAVLDHAPADVSARIYTSSSVSADRPDYLALRAPRMAIPFYRDMDMYVPRFRAFLAAARRDRIELVHYTTPGPMGLVAQYVAATLRLPMVGSFHTQLAEYTALLSGSPALGELMRQYLRWPYGRCARVLVPSLATRDLLAASGVGSGRLQVWSRGVDARRFDPSRRSPAVRARWRVGPQTAAVMYAGRVSREKGLDALPAVWRAIGALPVAARLVIVGEGPMKPELERALPGAHFTGTLSHDAVAEAMASADVFLFPSRTDTLGNVVLEAQASGLPVLVSDAGGPRENMIDGETGFVCRQTGGAEGFCGRLVELLTQPDRRLAAAQAARRYALSRTWPETLGPLYQSWRDTVAAWPLSAIGGAPAGVRGL